MANESGVDLVGTIGQEADMFTLLASFFSNPFVLILIGIIIGAVVLIIFFTVLWKRDEGTTFELEKFEDTTMDDLKKTFKNEGNKSKARIVHGINNPLGKVEKWLHHTGEWKIMEYDPNLREYKEKKDVVDIQIKDKEGKPKRNKKGKLITKKIHKKVRVSYDLMIFKVAGTSYFDDPKYIIADTKFVSYDSQANRWQIEPTISIKSFGKAWITSEMGEQYLQDISFRRSLENNLTFLQNQSRKVIFLETAFAQRHELLLGKGVAKRLQYDQHARDVLIKASQLEDTEEDQT